MSIKMQIDFSDFDKFAKQLEDLEKLPQKCVTSAARKAARALRKSIKSSPRTPEATGNLKKGLIVVPEKSKSKGKKVYQIVFDRSMNDVFQKKNASGKVSGYYPSSQEYGFFTKNGRYIPGYRFMRDTTEERADETEQMVLNTLIKELDKEWQKEQSKSG